MKNSIKILLGAGCLLASAVGLSANQIVNGSFESTPAFQNGTWGLFNSITGWTATGGQPIEIGTGGTYGVTGFDGNNVMELDSNGNVVASQIVASMGGSYTLSFIYAQRSGVSTTSGSFDVKWNGNLVGSFAPSSTAMTLFSTTVTAIGVGDTLEFIGTGTSDSLGALVDNVQLNSVPDGGSTLALLGGALGLIGFVARRRG